MCVCVCAQASHSASKPKTVDEGPQQTDSPSVANKACLQSTLQLTSTGMGIVIPTQEVIH